MNHQKNKKLHLFYVRSTYWYYVHKSSQFKFCTILEQLVGSMKCSNCHWKIENRMKAFSSIYDIPIVGFKAK